MRGILLNYDGDGRIAVIGKGKCGTVDSWFPTQIRMGQSDLVRDLLSRIPSDPNLDPLWADQI